MARTRVIHRCTECAAVAPKWSGQCATCGAWNSLVEEVETFGGRDGPLAGLSPASPVQRITEVSTSTSLPVPTGIGELDRVLGGGLVPGSVTLLGGEPGIGKSTLLLQVLAAHRGRSLYVSAEESAQQVKLRAERLGAENADLWLLSETTLPHVIVAIDDT